MTTQFRTRKPPVNGKELYGKFAPDITRGTGYFARTIDCAACLHITVCYPSHPRAKRVSVLRQFNEPYPRPACLDDRSGRSKLKEDALRNMKTENHPMVKAAQKKVK